MAVALTESAVPAPYRRHGRWLALWLFLAALAIPAAGGLLWYGWEDMLARYYFHRIREALAVGEEDRARLHLNELEALPPELARRELLRARRWPPELRRWLAERVAKRVRFRRQPGIFPGPAPPRPLGFGESFLETALALDPKNPQALAGTAENAFDQRDYATTVRQLEKMVRVAETRQVEVGYNEYSLLGRALYEVDRYADAEVIFRKILKRESPRMMIDPTPYIFLAECLQRQRRYAEAIAEICRFLVRSPGDGYALFQRAKLFANLGRHDLALADYEALLRRIDLANNTMLRLGGFPEQAHVLVYKARSLSALGRETEAAATRAEIRRRLAAHPWVGQMEAIFLEDEGAVEEAIATLKRAILQDPRDPTLYNNLAWLLATATDPAKRDPDESLRLALKAHALDGGRSPYILDTLAEAYFVNGAYAKAVEYEEKALARGAGTYSEAMERYRQALADHEAGREVVWTPHPLVDHHKPPPGDGGEGLDAAALPTSPRLSVSSYAEMTTNIARQGNPDLCARAMARIWLRLGPSAVDDPRKDLEAIFLALQRLFRGMATGDAHSAEATASHVFDGVLIGLGVLAGEPDRHNAVSILAHRAGERIGRMSREEVGHLLAAMAAGRLLPSRLLPPRERGARYMGQLSPEARAQLEKDWKEIEAVLIKAAEGKMLPPAPKFEKRRRLPPPLRPSVRRPFVPGPDDPADGGGPELDGPALPRAP